jgi:mRNA interferase RelE/StbE
MTSRLRYAIQIKRSAEKEMDRLPQVIFARVAAALLSLENDPRPRGCRKLRGSEQYRLRIGEYRVLYTVADSERLVEIAAVGHRKDVYG